MKKENNDNYKSSDSILRFLLSKDKEFKHKFLQQIENDPELREETLITAAFIKAVNSGQLSGENYESQDIRHYLFDEDIEFDKKFLKLLESDSCLRKELVDHVALYKYRMKQKEDMMYQHCFPDIHKLYRQVQLKSEKKKNIYQIGTKLLPLAACIIFAVVFFTRPNYKTLDSSILLVSLPDTSITNSLTEREMALVRKVCFSQNKDLSYNLERNLRSYIFQPNEISGINKIEVPKYSKKTINIMRYYLAIFYLKKNREDEAEEVLKEIIDEVDNKEPIYQIAESLLKSINRQ